MILESDEAIVIKCWVQSSVLLRSIRKLLFWRQKASHFRISVAQDMEGSSPKELD
jgi:hypothetical protein